MERTEQLKQVLLDIREQEDVGKVVSSRIDEMLMVLDEDIDLQLRIDRIRGILEELDDPQIPVYLRTQFWSVSAMLDML